MTPSDDIPFIRAICDTPFDDLPRLVYADWLEERGQVKRAEFVRVQIELAKHHARHESLSASGVTDIKKSAAFLALEDRERELWFPKRPIGYSEPLKLNELLGIEDLGNITVKESELRSHDRGAVVRRGSIDKLHCTLAQFMGRIWGRDHGPVSVGDPVYHWPGLVDTLFLVQPVTEVVLTDRWPTESNPHLADLHGSRYWIWPFQRDTTLPDEVMEYGDILSKRANQELGREVTRFSSPGLANHALSTVLVALGRKRAGLAVLA